MQIFYELIVKTKGQGLYDFTKETTDWVKKQKIHSGILNLNILHTSASLTIQENADPDVLYDISNFFNKLIPMNNNLYKHTNINNIETNMRYRLISDMGIIPGRITRLPIDTLPNWLTWQDESGDTYNPTENADQAAQIFGYAPSQDIEYNYNFTVRAFVDTQDASQFNERDFVITILEDASCISPVNNICT